MSQTLGLKELERKAWKSTFSDGIWDIYLGLLLLNLGFITILNRSGLPKAASYPFSLVYLLACVLVLWAGKKFITVPRLERVRFGEQRQKLRNWGRAGLFLGVLVLAALILLFTVARSGAVAAAGLELWFPAILALITLLAGGLAAFLTDFTRLYIIAILYTIPFPLVVYADQLAGVDLALVGFTLPGVLIVLMGVVMLVRFLRAYPPAESEVYDGGQ